MIVGLMVTKDEELRYLSSSLSSLKSVCDLVVVADDSSMDGTRRIARLHADKILERPKSVPTFLEDESAFRQWAWDALAIECGVQNDDWVLSLDADEQVGFGRDALRECVLSAKNCSRFSMHIREVWGDGVVRVDGFWDSNFPVRLTQYAPNGVNSFFKNKKMGCGSVPGAFESDQVAPAPEEMVIYHYGYATQASRARKSERYTSLQDHGHNPRHIQSILGYASLEPVVLKHFKGGPGI